LSYVLYLEPACLQRSVIGTERFTPPVCSPFDPPADRPDILYERK
jgi:hypothetical protein